MSVLQWKSVLHHLVLMRWFFFWICIIFKTNVSLKLASHSLPVPTLLGITNCFHIKFACNYFVLVWNSLNLICMDFMAQIRVITARTNNPCHNHQDRYQPYRALIPDYFVVCIYTVVFTDSLHEWEIMNRCVLYVWHCCASTKCRHYLRCPQSDSWLFGFKLSEGQHNSHELIYYHLHRLVAYIDQLVFLFLGGWMVGRPCHSPRVNVEELASRARPTPFVALAPFKGQWILTWTKAAMMDSELRSCRRFRFWVLNY